MFVSSINPVFVNPVATVSVLPQQTPFDCTRSVEPAAVVSAPFTTFPPPGATSSPWLSSGAFTVTVFSVSVCPAAFVSVPGPLITALVGANAVTEFVKLCVRFIVAPFSASVPVPLRVPPL